MKPQRKLNLPRRAHARDRAGAQRADARARIAEIRLVQEVEKLRTEGQPELLGKPEILVGPEVPGPITGRDHNIPSGIAEGVKRRRLEAARIEPMLDRPLRGRQVTVANAVRI